MGRSLGRLAVPRPQDIDEGGGGHAGHDDVGQDEGERVFAVVDELQRLVSGRCLGDGVSALDEDAPGDLADGRVVLDEQDVFAGPGVRFGGRGRLKFRRRLSGGGQADAESGAASRFRPQIDGAAGVGDDAVHGCQPQPASLAGAFVV